MGGVSSAIPSGTGTHKKVITLIKPRLFWDNISPYVKDEMKELRNILDEIAKTGGNDTQAKSVTDLMTANSTTLYTVGRMNTPRIMLYSSL